MAFCFSDSLCFVIRAAALAASEISFTRRLPARSRTAAGSTVSSACPQVERYRPAIHSVSSSIAGESRLWASTTSESGLSFRRTSD